MLSVVAQDSTTHRLVLCADSAGDPAVLRIYEAFAPLMTNLSTEIVSARGGTAGATRNAAFRAATTEWVTYLDGDDLLMPSAITDLQGAVVSLEADMVTAGIFRIGQDGFPRDMPESLEYRPPVWLYEVDPRTVGHWAHFNQPLTIRRDLWLRYPFDESTNREDVDFMLHQLLMGRFSKIPKALYGYRDVPMSFSSRSYVGGDLCAKRYNEGYYARLFAEHYDPRLKENFRA